MGWPDLPRFWWPSAQPNPNSGIQMGAGSNSHGGAASLPQWAYFKRINDGRGAEQIYMYKTTADAAANQNGRLVDAPEPGSVLYP